MFSPARHPHNYLCNTKEVSVIHSYLLCWASHVRSLKGYANPLRWAEAPGSNPLDPGQPTSTDQDDRMLEAVGVLMGAHTGLLQDGKRGGM